MNETEILELEQKHLANVYAKKDLIIVKGQGANLWDINNKKYIVVYNPSGSRLK